MSPQEKPITESEACLFGLLNSGLIRAAEPRFVELLRAVIDERTLPTPCERTTAELDGLTVTLHRSKIDGRRVVQIETENDPELTGNGLSPMRIFVNDGRAYECDDEGREEHGEPPMERMERLRELADAELAEQRRRKP